MKSIKTYKKMVDIRWFNLFSAAKSVLKAVAQRNRNCGERKMPLKNKKYYNNIPLTVVTIIVHLLILKIVKYRQ